MKFVKGQKVWVRAVIDDPKINDGEVCVDITRKNAGNHFFWVLASSVVPALPTQPVDHAAIRVGDEVTVALHVKVTRVEKNGVYGVDDDGVAGFVDIEKIVGHIPLLQECFEPPATAAELAKLPAEIAERVYAELVRKAVNP